MWDVCPPRMFDASREFLMRAKTLPCAMAAAAAFATAGDAATGRIAEGARDRVAGTKAAGDPGFARNLGTRGEADFAEIF